MSDDGQTTMTSDQPRMVMPPHGYVSAEGFLYDKFYLKEADGDFEDLLGDDTTPFTARLEELVYQSLARLEPCDDDRKKGAAVITDRKAIRALLSKLPGDDRLYLLLQIRIIAPGPDYWWEADCPHCQYHQTQPYDLRTMEVKLPVDKRVRVFDVEPKPGMTVKMRVFDGECENELEAIKKERGTVGLFTSRLFVRIVSVNGKPTDWETVKSWGMSIRTPLRWAYERNESDIQSLVWVRCKNCSGKFQIRVTIGDQSFFFPSEMSNVSTERLVSAPKPLDGPPNKPAESPGANASGT